MPRQNTTEDRGQKTEDRGQRAEDGPESVRGAGQKTAPGTGIDLAAENAALKARIAELESAKSRIDADEVLITAKMAKGLRREQARAVINRQREYDRRKTESKKQKAEI